MEQQQAAPSGNLPDTFTAQYGPKTLVSVSALPDLLDNLCKVIPSVPMVRNI